MVARRTGKKRQNRYAEPLALHPRDLNNRVLWVRRGKGGKYRTVALDSEARAVLTMWIEREARLKITGPVLSTHHGEEPALSVVAVGVGRQIVGF